MLNPTQQNELLKLARESIKQHLAKQDLPPHLQTDPALQAPAGAFVSLHQDGELRGCIGTFSADRPLAEVVQDMALAAATGDPRFPSMEAEALEAVDIEISVLSPRRRIEDPKQVEVGTHGIFITRDFYSGVLLPQVATEYGWGREEFLAQTCLKAGLPPEAWKDPKTSIEVFSAQVFGEKEKTSSGNPRTR